jgi:hypothetical protein
MEYYVGFDTSVKDWVTEFRFQEILEDEGLGHLDPFSDEGCEALDGWGFCPDTWFEQSNDELLLQERPDIFQGRRLEAKVHHCSARTKYQGRTPNHPMPHILRH